MRTLNSEQNSLLLSFEILDPSSFLCFVFPAVNVLYQRQATYPIGERLYALCDLHALFCHYTILWSPTNTIMLNDVLKLRKLISHYKFLCYRVCKLEYRVQLRHIAFHSHKLHLSVIEPWPCQWNHKVLSVLMLHTGWAKNVSLLVFLPNFVYCQPIFRIFGTRIL